MRGLMRKVRRDEGGFTLIELLIVIIILGVLAAVVAFNVGGFLGQGTLQTAQTEASSVQTAILAGMAGASVGTVTGGTVTAGATTAIVAYTGGSFDLATYLKLPTHGTWTYDASGNVISGTYSGGGKTCTLATVGGVANWSCGE